MAAQLGTRVWIFGVGDFAALTAAQKIQLKAPIKIKTIYWKNPTTLGDTFSIVDNSAAIIQDGIAEAGGQSQLYNKDNWFQGISNIALVSGILEINIL